MGESVAIDVLMYGKVGAADSGAGTDAFGAASDADTGKVNSIDIAGALSGMMSHTPPAASIARLYWDATVWETAFLIV